MSSLIDSSSEGSSASVAHRFTGRVKWFNNKAGYGFVTSCEGELKDKDVFVHYSSIQVPGDQYKYLVQGEYVDFELSKSDKSDHEYHAVAISGVKGGSLMCETRRQTQEKRPYKPRVYKTPDEGSSTTKSESKTGGRAKRDEAKDTAPADGFTKVSKRGKPIAK